LQRKLVETRADIARRLTEDDENTEHFTQVLEHLDHLIVPPANSKRVVSAPVRSPEHPAPLHAIPEEVKVDSGAGFETYSPHYRAVTDPVRPQACRAVTAQETIRVVDQSPTRVAPLNIRKRSGASLSSRVASDVPTSIPWPGPVGSVRSYHDVQKDLLAARANIPPPVPGKQPIVKKKKSLWFRRNVEEKEQEIHDAQVKTKKSTVLLQIPQAWQGLDDRIKNDPSPTLGIYNEANRHMAKQSESSNVSEFPMRNTGSAATKSDSAPRKGFLGLFGKKKEEKAKSTMELDRKCNSVTYQCFADASTVNFSSSSLLSNNFGPDSSEVTNRTGPPEIQKNWLSRFLHIKPATKTLCFQIGRGKVRQDLVRLLRDWQRFGVRDVDFDRKTNVVTAHVDKVNRKCSSPSRFLFSEWSLQNFCFKVDVFEVGSALRCNCAFLITM
jgi:hypothetical protein